MEFKIYKGVDECHRLWNHLSPNSGLFDLWDFRQCFYNRNEHELHFVAGRRGKDILGLVPLNFSKRSGQYTYFGGWFPERNSFFLKDKAILSELLQNCPDNTLIEGIDPGEGKYFSFPEDEYTYYLDLFKYDNNFDNYFNSFGKKRRKNFKRELMNIPKYKVHYNRLRDFKRLVELNIAQYDEDSVYNNQNIKKGIYNMMKLANQKGILQMVSVEIKGKVEAVDVGVLFGKWYHVITGSSNNEKIKNLGKLITVLSIKNAIEKKAGIVNFFASSGYWKDMWSFEKEMLLKYTR